LPFCNSFAIALKKKKKAKQELVDRVTAAAASCKMTRFYAFLMHFLLFCIDFQTRNSRTDHHMPHHDSHETQPMVALASPTNNGQSLMKTSKHHHSAMKLDEANA